MLLPATPRWCGESKKTVLMQMTYHHDWPDAAAELLKRCMGPKMDASDSEKKVACVDAQDGGDDAYTALRYAAINGRRETVRVLLENGADKGDAAAQAKFSDLRGVHIRGAPARHARPPRGAPLPPNVR